MERSGIDWDNLQPLPRKRKSGATREDLAERRFNMQKAKHKGRCHITNQKRRQIARAVEAEGRKKADDRNEKCRTFKNRVRLYWLGLLPEHPTLP